MLENVCDAGPTLNQHWTNVLCLRESPPAQQTQHICITFIQRRPNVFNVGPTLYKVIQMFLAECRSTFSVYVGLSGFSA